MTKRITNMALLTAVALIIFIIEAQIPPIVPISGAKIGLANIVTVYAMLRLGPRDTLCILLCRIVLGSFFVGNVTAVFYSLAGGIMCYLSMLIMRRIVTKKQLWALSAVGAIFHNIGQIIAAMLIMKTTVVLMYLPALLAIGIPAGIFTGLCAQLLVNRADKSRPL